MRNGFFVFRSHSHGNLSGKFDMKLFVGQIYAEAGINFPFTYHFQVWIGEKLTKLVRPSNKFIKRFGADFKVIFRMSAKTKIQSTEIRGPTVYKKDKDVEWSIFLPYDVIDTEKEKFAGYASALDHLLKARSKTLASFEIDTSAIERDMARLIKEACANPLFFNETER